MDIKGKIHEVFPTFQVTENLKKREFVIEYAENPQYPEYLKMEAVQDKCVLLDNLRPGQEVEVFFNLRGRPWTDKTGKKSYFNSLQLWRINVLAESASQVDINTDIDESDMPF